MNKKVLISLSLLVVASLSCSTLHPAPSVTDTPQEKPTAPIPTSSNNPQTLLNAPVHFHQLADTLGVTFSNPPSLCADAGDIYSSVQFVVHGTGELDRISPWIPVNKGGVGCWQDSSPWSVQPHPWQVKQRDAQGNQSPLSDAQFGLTALVPSDNNNPYQSAETCKIDSWPPDLPSPQVAGTGIYFNIHASCTTGVKYIFFAIDGGTQISVIEGASGGAVWSTTFDYAGDHIVELYVFGNQNGFAYSKIPYTLTDK
jgi:hypothetical protein